MVDTKEKRPYEFPTPWRFGGLKTGDYSIEGYEHLVTVERKKPNELFPCFTTDRDRFRREYERMSAMQYAVVVIEGHIEDCATRYDAHSGVNPHVVINTLESWAQRYKVDYRFAGDRLLAQTLTYRILQKFFALRVEKISSSRENHATHGTP